MLKQIIIFSTIVATFLSSFPQIKAQENYVGLSRFGAGRVAEMFIDNTELMNQYHFGWFHNWGSTKTTYLKRQEHPYVLPESVAFVPLFGGYSPKTEYCTEILQEEIKQIPDRSFIWIGNEIGWDDRTDPTTYAKKYNNLYTCIKQVNPSLKVAMGANVGNPNYPYGSSVISNWIIPNDQEGDWNNNSSINYYDYKNLVIKKHTSLFGATPVQDFHVIHVYPMSDGIYNIEAIKGYITNYRRYMKSLGDQNKDLYIKEMGFLQGTLENAERNSQVMVDIHKMLLGLKDPQLGNQLDDDMLVQRWSWFIAVARPNTAPNSGNWEQTAFMICPAKGIQNYDTNCTGTSAVETTLGKRYREFASTLVEQLDTTPPEIKSINYSEDPEGFIVAELDIQETGRLENIEYAISTDYESKYDITNWTTNTNENNILLENMPDNFVLSVVARDADYNESKIFSKQINTTQPTQVPSPQPTTLTPTIGESDPKYDVNKNGKVDIFDVIDVLKYIFK